MRIFVSLVLAFSFFIGNTAASYGQIKIKRLDGSAISSTEIESAVTRLMKAARVTGIAVAIINDSKIAYVKSFGFEQGRAKAADRANHNVRRIFYKGGFCLPRHATG